VGPQETLGSWDYLVSQQKVREESVAFKANREAVEILALLVHLDEQVMAGQLATQVLLDRRARKGRQE